MDWLAGLLDWERLGWRDALDILLVAVLVHAIASLLRRTRAAPVAIGIVLFVIAWQLALALNLPTLGTLMDIAVTALPFVIVLLFQNPLRRAFMTLGRNPLFRFFAPEQDLGTLDNIALATLSLSSQRLGAIVVIEREIGLRTFIASGISIDAKVSYEILLALFHPKSPLHDGAVIIQQDRIAAASCLLPLTQKPQLSVKYGSRHRAAIGLSEEADAIIIVVSEERGVISIVRDGEVRSVEAKELRDELVRELAPGRARAAERGTPAPASGAGGA